MSLFDKRSPASPRTSASRAVTPRRSRSLASAASSRPGASRPRQALAIRDSRRGANRFGLAQPPRRFPEGVLQRGLGGQPQRDRPEQQIPAGSAFGFAERHFCGGAITGGQGNGAGVAKPGRWPVQGTALRTRLCLCGAYRPRAYHAVWSAFAGILRV
jgi:hypothetical protein